MGDMADYYLEQGFEAMLRGEEEEEEEDYLPKSRYMWRGSDGKCVWISKMTDSHLINTIRYLKRTGNNYALQLDEMLKQAKKRGIYC